MSHPCPLSRVKNVNHQSNNNIDPAIENPYSFPTVLPATLNSNTSSSLLRVMIWDFLHANPFGVFFYPPLPFPTGREGQFPLPCQQGRGLGDG
jgi:hypothetical protein